MNQLTIKLQERTKQLAIAIMQTIKTIRVDSTNKHIVSQILRSSSSIGANYHEAIESESKSDFIHKLSVCKKEANETLYWLDLLLSSNSSLTLKINNHVQETSELVKIFAAAIATTKRSLHSQNEGIIE